MKLVLVIKFEGLGKLFQLPKVQDHTLEVNTGVFREVHLVDYEVWVEVAEKEVFLKLGVQSFKDLRGDSKELSA